MCVYLYIYYLKVKVLRFWSTIKRIWIGFFKLKDNSNVNKDLNALAKLAKWINVYHFIQHVTQMLPY